MQRRKVCDLCGRPIGSHDSWRASEDYEVHLRCQCPHSRATSPGMRGYRVRSVDDLGNDVITSGRITVRHKTL